jgi:hypothetical protein
MLWAMQQSDLSHELIAALFVSSFCRLKHILMPGYRTPFGD